MQLVPEFEREISWSSCLSLRLVLINIMIRTNEHNHHTIIIDLKIKTKSQITSPQTTETTPSHHDEALSAAVQRSLSRNFIHKNTKIANIEITNIAEKATKMTMMIPHNAQCVSSQRTSIPFLIIITRKTITTTSTQSTYCFIIIIFSMAT